MCIKFEQNRLMYHRLMASERGDVFFWATLYNLYHRECGQFRPNVHENFEKFEIISTRWAVGFDRAGGAIESNCPSGSKLSRIFQNFHEHWDGTVHTLDGTEYTPSHREYWTPSSPMSCNFANFEMISTTTGSWTQSHRRPHQLPVVVEIISKFANVAWQRWRGCPHSWWDRI